MILPSYSFIFIFLPIVIILYHLLNNRNFYPGGKLVLLAASLFFYYSMGFEGFIALCLSIIICYLIGRYGENPKNSIVIRRLFLILGIVVNILFLLYCKYLSYFETIINKHTGSNLSFTAIVIPVGISYFTFSQIAFLVDSYKNDDISYSFLDYALFVVFFPKITVGPIALSTEFIPQFNDASRKQFSYANMSRGFYRFTLGLSKKLLIADNLATFVDIGYQNISALGTTNAFLVTLAYTLQIYFDFSGYCDIASGICTMLNLELTENFDAPYKALSIAEFWKRWHISLTRFFTRYVYIPLGGNRKGTLRTYINTMIIFLISGLWHGAATTFIVWGAVHGVGMVISKIIAPVSKKIPKIIRWILTFAFVDLAWIFFRSPDLTTAAAMFEQLFTGGFIPVDVNIVAACIPVEGKLLQWIIYNYAPAYTYYTGSGIIIALIALAMFICLKAKTAAYQVQNFTLTHSRMIITVILFAWSVLSLSQVSEFIYVNF